jgi:predicted transcriptional regulator
MTAPTDIKEEARRLVEQLPPDASWDDLMYEIYVRQSIDRGLADAEAGRLIPHEEVVKRFARPK